MIIRQCALDTVIGITSQLPLHEECEIAFAGRSNVGKSSLINGLLNRKSLARTSSEPGKTQTINYYKINGEFFLVDLPGYGYARVSLAVREKWGKMIERYLKTSPSLKQVVLLLDIRHAPNDNDLQMYRWIVSAGFTPLVVATKLDKIKRSQVAGQVALIRKTLKAPASLRILPFSSVTRAGRDEIWAAFEEVLDPSPDRGVKE